MQLAKVFQLFDRQENRITTFLEAPYRYVAPETSERNTEGVGRRDLAHDLYFGLRVGSQATWLHDQTDIEYEEQTHVIHGRSTALGVSVDTYYFAPFGYEGNGMVMLLRITNNGAQELSVSAFAKANMKLGQGRTASDVQRPHTEADGGDDPLHERRRRRRTATRAVSSTSNPPSGMGEVTQPRSLDSSRSDPQPLGASESGAPLLPHPRAVGSGCTSGPSAATLLAPGEGERSTIQSAGTSASAPSSTRARLSSLPGAGRAVATAPLE